MKHLARGLLVVFLAAGCGGSEPAPTAVPGPTTSPPVLTEPPSGPQLRDGLPERLPADLVPPQMSSARWENTFAGVDTNMESEATFDELVAFYTGAAGEPTKVSDESGVNKAFWLNTRDDNTQTVVIVTDGDPVSIFISGLF